MLRHRCSVFLVAGTRVCVWGNRGCGSSKAISLDVIVRQRCYGRRREAFAAGDSASLKSIVAIGPLSIGFLAPPARDLENTGFRVPSDNPCGEALDDPRPLNTVFCIQYTAMASG